MSKIKYLFTLLASKIGFFSICRKILIKDGNLVIMFHGITSKKSSEIPIDLQPHLDILEFESIIRWIGRRFSFISPEDLFKRKRKGVLLTFDDGFENNFNNVLPILSKFQIPALFFVTTQHIINPDKWLHFIDKRIKSYGLDKNMMSDFQKSENFNGISEKNLIMMSKNKLVTIGSHSITHPFLSNCSNIKLKKEIFDSKKYLEKICNKKVDYFAYPSGDYNEKVVKELIASGFKASFGTDSIKNIGFPNYEIPRVGIYSSDVSYLSAKFSGLYQGPLKLLKNN